MGGIGLAENSNSPHPDVGSVGDRNAEITSERDENLLRLPAKHAIQGELPGGGAAQFKEKFAAIVRQGVDGVDQAHAGFFVQVRAVGNLFKEHQGTAVKVRLGDQGDEFLVGQGSLAVCGQDKCGSSAVGQLEDAELLVFKRR